MRYRLDPLSPTGLSTAIPQLLAISSSSNNSSSGASGVGPATLTVAASDAPASIKARADYACDGVADDVEINAAIAALTVGGTVECTSGTFNIAATIDNNVNAVLVKGQVVTHFGKSTIFKASGAFTTFAKISAQNPGGFQDIYMDGNGVVTDGLIIGSSSLVTKIKNPRVRNVVVSGFTGRGVGGVGLIASGSWDDATFDNLRARICGIGVENASTQTTFLGGSLGGCTTGLKALVSSAANLFGTTFTTNTNDIDFATDNLTGAYSFHGTYHESSTDSILKRSVAPIGSHTLGGITFNGSYLRNQSAAGSGYVMDLTNIGGTVLLNNCSFDTAAGSSKTINVGTNTIVVINGLGNAVAPLFAGTTGNVTYLGDTRFGIGKSAPDSLLHLYESSSGVGANTGAIIEQAGTGDSIAQFILTGVRRWVMGIDNSDSDKFKISSTIDLNSNPRITIDTTGRVGVNTATPLAELHLPAGTSTANTAPLKFTSGTNLATPEAGAVEFDGSHLYVTVGSTRYQLDQQATTPTADYTTTLMLGGM